MIHLLVIPLLVPAIISGAAALGSAVIGAVANNRSAKKSAQRQHTNELENMEIQNRYNIEAFNRENEYNTPLAQSQRLRAAGINPNWIDGGMSTIAQQDSGVSPSTSTGNSAVDMSSYINSGLQAAKLAAEIDNINADTRNKNTESDYTAGAKTKSTEAQTSLLLEQARGVCLQNGITAKEFDAFDQKLGAELSKINAETGYYISSANAVDWKLPKEIDKLVSDTAKGNAEAEKALAEVARYAVQNKVDEIHAKNETQLTANDTKRVAIEKMRANTERLTSDRNFLLGRINAENVREMNHILQAHYERQDAISKYGAEALAEYQNKLAQFTDEQIINAQGNNVILGFEIAARRYARVHHIDTQLLDLQLETFREGIYELQSRKELNKANVDKLATETLCTPMMIFGNMSGYGINPQQMGQQPQIPYIYGNGSNVTW